VYLSVYTSFKRAVSEILFPRAIKPLRKSNLRCFSFRDLNGFVKIPGTTMIFKAFNTVKSKFVRFRFASPYRCVLFLFNATLLYFHTFRYISSDKTSIFNKLQFFFQVLCLVRSTDLTVFLPSHFRGQIF